MVFNDTPRTQIAETGARLGWLIKHQAPPIFLVQLEIGETLT